jgi:hypothetical protein
MVNDGNDMTGNLKTGLVLTTIAIAFFIGVMIRHWLW